MNSGDVNALDDVSLSIYPGEFVSIMGPSGSGKSTLMHMIGCLDTPTSGNIYINGRNTKNISDNDLTLIRRDEIGFIFQKYNLINLLTAYENVDYPIILKEGHNDTTGKVKIALESVGITENQMSHTPLQLSGGQQQRVAIARALINDPTVLLCDEPTGNLDSKMGAQIMSLLQDLNKKGRTIVVVTHDPNIANYSSRKIYIKDGHIISDKN
ncbi:MAG TPA: ABC transporter ATP-binding protein [Methanocorpusculum sp.]|nr:ABC transporter ATP-binding protein [Methanocorpusculum sp.]